MANNLFYIQEDNILTFSNSNQNVDTVSDHNARLLQKYRVSFNSTEEINFVNRTFSSEITLKGSSHPIEEWLTTKDPAKRAGFQASAVLYIPESLFFLERLLPYMISMRNLLPFLEEEDRIWEVLNTDISTIDVEQLEQILHEKEKNLKEAGSLSPDVMKKREAEIRTIKDLIRLKNDPADATKQLVKDIHHLQLGTQRILNDAYPHLLEIWNNSLRENCPLPLNRSETAISDIKSSNIEQLISVIEELRHNSEVRLRKPIFGRETDKNSFFNDTHKRTNTLSQPIAKEEEIEVKDPVELYLMLQQKQVYLLNGFNKVLNSVIYNAVGNEGIKQCERYESDYEEGAKKWQNSKQLPGPIQVNDNNIAVVARWIHKNVLNLHSLEPLQKKTSFWGKLLTKKSSPSAPITPRVNKSESSYSQEALKLENKIAPLAEKLMNSKPPLSPNEREEYSELLSMFDSLVILRPEYIALQKEIRNLLAPPETKSKVMEELQKKKSDDDSQEITLSF
ncbi:hypothetical protein [Legionella fallonii]|uniref:Uncharacterized protein n=1 Tax=Legionella fallonii LLAP-10 TaxID=1212491 RepID=A0A098G457_9GAMM|nr:hypothetical protein [Legionella fallonii]CEG57268.1 conserved protein of unknown function [coiled-coil domain] [Legionella fallonii LLAP-10]